jgi:hypothetical protein
MHPIASQAIVSVYGLEALSIIDIEATFFSPYPQLAIGCLEQVMNCLAHQTILLRERCPSLFVP